MHDVSHPSCNFHEILRDQVVGDALSLVTCQNTDLSTLPCYCERRFSFWTGTVPDCPNSSCNLSATFPNRRSDRLM